jgi:GNAT superfamily N-acetyltransferase
MVLYGRGVTSTPRVRRLRREDRAHWDDLWQRYLRFYRTPLADEVSDHTFERLCAGDDLVALVAVDDSDRAVGLAHLVFHPSTWTTQPYCYLEDLYVHPDHRGARIAHELFDAVSGTARERGAARVYWLTQQYNGAARSLYDVVGRLTSFVVYERDV